MFASLFAAGCLCGAGAAAQTFSVERIDNPAADLGKLVAAASGDTVFRIDPDTGDITKVSGAGSRMSASSVRPQITIRCSKGGKALLCNTQTAVVQIGALGSTSGRARALTNLTAAAGTGTISLPKKAGDLLSLTVGPLGEGGIATFYLGGDFTIAGDSSGLATGPASAQFHITVSKIDGSEASTTSGIIESTVLRPLTVVADTSLNFGMVTRPTQGDGKIIIDPVKGTRTLEGQGVQGLSSAGVGPAAFTVSGEGGQVFSVSVPASFEMKTQGGSVTVSTSHSAGGTQTLRGRAGRLGTATFNVGGTFPLSSSMRTGTYTGTFQVSVQYN